MKSKGNFGIRFLGCRVEGQSLVIKLIFTISLCIKWSVFPEYGPNCCIEVTMKSDVENYQT